MNITTGIQNKPIKAVIYGPEGIGKTTFAAQFPKPLFIDTEGSTARIDVARTDTPTSLAMLTSILTELRSNDHGFRTIVLDTADWAEKLCIRAACSKKEGISGIEDFGYAKGYIYALTRWEKFTSALDLVREKHRMTIVCIAHAKIANVRNPAGDDYNAFTPRLHEKAMGHVAEWADAVLFASRAMRTDKDTKKASGLGFEPGGDRLLTCTGSPAVTAKNRYGMPETLPLSWAALAPYLPGFATLPQPDAAPNASATGTDAGAANQNNQNN